MSTQIAQETQITTKMGMVKRPSRAVVQIAMIPIQVSIVQPPKSGMMASIKTVMDSLTTTKMAMDRIQANMADQMVMT